MQDGGAASSDTGGGGGDRISVVIPAYNEAATIRLCLDALVPQLREGDEVVLVDNNSRDDTAAIAAGYERVRVVPESRAGVTFAVPTGMDAASGDVLARIDADCIVARDYVEQLRALFSARPDLGAISGSSGIAELSPRGAVWFRWYYRGFRTWHERSIGVRPMLYGFNSAVRRATWEAARPMISIGDTRFMDDVDMSIAVHRTGARVEYAPRVRLTTRLFRSIAPEKLKGYYRRDEQTLAKHGYGNPRRRARGEAALAAEHPQ